MRATFDLGPSALLLVVACSACSSRAHADRPSGAVGSGGAPPPLPAAAEATDAPAPPSPRSSPPAAGPFFVADPGARAVLIRRADAPNMRYASLDRAACEAELTRRAVPFVVAEATTGVMAPVRLRGPMHGVSIHTDRPPKEREKSKYEIFDCRLMLALDDLSEMVAKRDVTEILHFNAFRPTTEHGCTAKYWGLQHCAALAIDVRELRRKDGTSLNVDRDFHGHLGAGTCAAGVGPAPQSKAAEELWSILCEAASRALFNVMLTPNYNAEHKNHFHLEVTPEAGWMMVK